MFNCFYYICRNIPPMRLLRVTFNLLLVLMVFLFTTCNKEYEVESRAVLKLDSDKGCLILTILPPVKTQWKVTQKPSWLSIEPSSGTTDQQDNELALGVNATGLTRMYYSETVKIVTDVAGEASTIVGISLDPYPIAYLPYSTIRISGNETQANLVIKNTGRGALDWHFEEDIPWLKFSRQEGTVHGGLAETVVVTADRSNLPPGTYEEQLLLMSNSVEGGTLKMNFVLEVPGTAVLQTSPSSLYLGHFKEETSFYIFNKGNSPSQWEVKHAAPYLSLNPQQGDLQPGDSVQVHVNLDRSSFDTTTSYSTVITITNSLGNDLTMNVEVDHYHEEKWIIEGWVLAAEYDRTSDRLIMATDEPKELRVYDLAASHVMAVPLGKLATALSVSPTGSHAAVGYDGGFYLVNLSNMQIQGTYSLPFTPLTMVLTDDWVYAFPIDNHEFISMNLVSGQTYHQQEGYVGAGISGKLHPSGKYIYRAGYYLGLDKYDISEGVPVFVASYQTHVNGPLWHSDDGQRLFTQNGKIFRSSENAFVDMNYNGTLQGAGVLRAFDYSSNAAMAVGVFESFYDKRPDNILNLYETSYMSLKRQITLPPFMFPDESGVAKSFKSQGYYTFFNSSGTQLCVVLRAASGSGSLKEWAITTIDL